MVLLLVSVSQYVSFVGFYIKMYKSLLSGDTFCTRVERYAQNNLVSGYLVQQRQIENAGASL